MFVNLLLEVVYQYRCVGNVAENQNASFHPGDDAFPEKDTEQPKQDAGPYEYPQIEIGDARQTQWSDGCLLYTSPSPRDRTRSRMPSSA